MAQQISLKRVDGSPATYETKWSEIHDDSKAVLLAIEKRIREYRAESLALDECERVSNLQITGKDENFEHASNKVRTDLRGLSIRISREEEAMGTTKVLPARAMLRHAEFSNSLRHRSGLREGMGFVESSGSSSSSSLLEDCLASFQSRFFQYLRQARELEKVLKDGDLEVTPFSSVQSLNDTIHRNFEILKNEAAQVEALHERVEELRSFYLFDRRRENYTDNPFVEADRREEQERQMAGRLEHPSALVASEPAMARAPAAQQILVAPGAQQAVASTTFMPGAFSFAQGPWPPAAAPSTPAPQAQMATPLQTPSSSRLPDLVRSAVWSQLQGTHPAPQPPPTPLSASPSRAPPRRYRQRPPTVTLFPASQAQMPLTTFPGPSATIANWASTQGHGGAAPVSVSVAPGPVPPSPQTPMRDNSALPPRPPPLRRSSRAMNLDAFK